jgi:DNA-binding beta-propeller fold protein YncE
VVGTHAGEFTSEMLVPFIDDLIAKARSGGTTNEESLHFEADPPTMAPARLRYPGKVAVRGAQMAIADSGNNRVIIGSLDQSGMALRVEKTVGDGTPGFKDGLTPKFRYPQGLAFGDGVLFVADTENHAIRTVNLQSGEVTTLAGTGRQMRTRGDQQAGAMSSPWDVALSGDTLFVAMAGIHQIWSVDVATGKSRVRYGTGGEDIRDGDRASALLAQPMGIVIEKERLYFTDSESNGVRWADASEDGAVGTIVGTGLFDFGDVDGRGDDVRLQHPQGIASHSSGKLLIADSYNDCLKWVDPETREVKTWGGGFHEPGGVCFASSHAYVADTNAHRIAVMHIDTRDVTELRIE